MDASNQNRTPTTLQRHLSNLKLVSRLLGHELHSQSNAKAISLSRDAVQEIQTTLDLFIEEVTRGQGSFGSGTGAAAPTTRMVGNQN